MFSEEKPVESRQLGLLFPSSIASIASPFSSSNSCDLSKYSLIKCLFQNDQIFIEFVKKFNGCKFELQDMENFLQEFVNSQLSSISRELTENKLEELVNLQKRKGESPNCLKLFLNMQKFSENDNPDSKKDYIHQTPKKKRKISKESFNEAKTRKKHHPIHKTSFNRLKKLHTEDSYNRMDLYGEIVDNEKKFHDCGNYGNNEDNYIFDSDENIDKRTFI